MNISKASPKATSSKKMPRLTAMDRLVIETGLNAGKTPYAIAQEIGRPPKTVMREIKGRAIESDKGAVGRVNNRWSCGDTPHDLREHSPKKCTQKPK